MRITKKKQTKMNQISDLRRKAKQGNAEAQYKLGLWYMDEVERLGLSSWTGERVEKAFRCFSDAAWQSHAEAMHELAYFYAGGNGGAEQSDELKAHWLRLAADKGYVLAIGDLGTCYLHEVGVPHDVKKGLRLIRQAAALGGTDAQYDLGELSHEGKYLPKNEVLARKWFKKAAAKGHLGAQDFLKTGITISERMHNDYMQKELEARAS